MTYLAMSIGFFKNAKAGCFAEGLITQAVPLHSRIEVNGKPFHIEGVTET